MDPEITHEALRRLTEEISREEEAAELAKQKALEEEKAAEARIHDEFIRLRAEEERIRIEAEKLALQAQAKRLAEQKEAAIQAELERLRNRTPVEVLRDDFKLIVKQFNSFLKKPDHTEPLAVLQAKLDKALEENARLQALSSGFQTKLDTLSKELTAVKTGKTQLETDFQERISFIEKACLNSNKINLWRQFRAQKNIRRGYLRFTISKGITDTNQFTIKFSDSSDIVLFKMRFSRTDKNIYMSHLQYSRGPFSPEKFTSSGLFETVHRNQSNLCLFIDIYPTKLILKSPNGEEVFTYMFTYMAQLGPNDIFNWADLTPDMSEAQGCSCVEQE
jgi:hypothetical protein